MDEKIVVEQETIVEKQLKGSSSLRDELDDEVTILREKYPTIMRNVTSEIRAIRDAGVVDSALQVGEQAPEFKLKAADGKIVDSNKLLKRGPLIVTFYHGDWSSLCMLALKSMQQHLEQFESKGARLVAISPQTEEHAKVAAAKSGSTFPLLSDGGNQLAKKFRLIYMMDTELPGSKEDPWPLPMTTTYVIDKDGIVTYAFVNCDHTKRAEPSDVLDALPVYNKKKRGDSPVGSYKYDVSDLPEKKDDFWRCVYPLVRDRNFRMRLYESAFVGQGMTFSTQLCFQGPFYLF
jgi:peroxiredoxin